MSSSDFENDETLDDAQKNEDDSMPKLSSAGPVEPKNSDKQESDEASSQPKKTSGRRFIGPYKILQKIAEGGMGAVYMAEQEKPIRRRVALKLIKASRQDSKEIEARFEAERQALAIMDHPCIAKILDAGADEDGSPYFVMELVNGIPITEFCDRNKLSIQERLELFILVSQAVQHAHLKGIVHRDLHPGNVLVGLVDGVATPKIIDFGLAKATQHTHQLTDKTMFTEFGRVVGTVRYMSPEQAGLDQMDIDTRTDVYSLGVLLYELLTGSTPLDQKSLQHALIKVLELIREKDPERPSQRLASSDAAIGIGQHRSIGTEKLHRMLKGELDWIVMKALEKNRNRRYETAADLVQDVRRFLNQEPVVARPPSTYYRLSKLVRANRGLVATVATTMAALSIATVVSTYYYLKADDATEKLGTKIVEINEKNDELNEKNTELNKTTEELEEEKVKLGKSLRNEAEATKQANVQKQNAEWIGSRANFLLSAANWDLDRPALAAKQLDAVLEQHRALEFRFARHHYKTAAFSSTHKDEITHFDVSQSANLIAIAQASPNSRVTFLDMRTGIERSRIELQGSQVQCLEISPDGKYVALGFGTGGNSGSNLQILDISSGVPVKPFSNDATEISHLAYSDDGNHLVAVTGGPNNQKALIFSIGTGTVDRTIQLPQKSVSQIKVKGDVLYACGGGVTNVGVRLWNWKTGNSLTAYNEGKGTVLFDISTSGKYLVAVPEITINGSGERAFVYITNLETSESIGINKGHPGRIQSVEISEDERTFVTTCLDGVVRVWDLQTGDPIRSLKSNLIRVFDARFSKDASQVFCRGYASGVGYQIKTWDLDKLQGRITFSQTSTVSPAMLRDKRMATIDELGSLQVWNTDNFEIVERVPGFPTDEYLDFKFSEDEQRVYGATLRGDLVTFDRKAGKPVTQSLYPEGGGLVAAAIWPDDMVVFVRLVEHDRDGLSTNFEAWDIKSGEKKWVRPVEGMGYLQLQITGERFVARSVWLKKCHVLDSETGQPLLEMEGVSSFAVDESDNLLYVVKNYGNSSNDLPAGLLALDLESGDLVRQAESITSSNAVKIFDDQIAVIQWSSVQMLDTNLHKKATHYQNHTSELIDIAVLPDESRMVLLSGDSTIRIYDLEKREELFVVNDVDISRHSRIIVDGAGENIMVPVSGLHLQWFRASSSDETFGVYPNLLSDTQLNRSSRIRWHERELQLAFLNDDIEKQIFHLACILTTAPDNPFHFYRYQDVIQNWKASDNRNPNFDPWVVQRAYKITCGPVNESHVSGLLNLLDSLHDRRKYDYTIEIVTSIFQSLEQDSLPIEWQRLLHGYLGVALAEKDRATEAIEHLEFARQLQPVQQMVRGNDQRYANRIWLGETHILRAVQFSEQLKKFYRSENKIDEVGKFAWEDWQKAKQSGRWRSFEIRDIEPTGLARENLTKLLDSVVKDLIASGRMEQAQQVAGANLRLQTKLGPSTWQTAVAKSMLGECFLSSKQFGPAKEMLEEAAAQLVEQQDQLPKLQRNEILRASLERVIQLHQTQDDQQALEKYQKLLDELVSD